MKKMKKNTVACPRAEFVYSTLLDDTIINDAYFESEFKWVSTNYRESYLSTIKNRDRAVEFSLKFVNSLLIEYHTHCHWEYWEDYYNEHYRLIDKNPTKSKAVLLRAQEYIEIIFKKIEPWRSDYNKLAISLMFEIYKQLRSYGVYHNPIKELQRMQTK